MLLLTEGQASDHRGAALMLHKLPPASELIGDRGYDSGRFRAELAARGIAPCIPLTRRRKVPIPHDTVPYRQRHRIEIMFRRLKDWRRIAICYDRCARTFSSAITIAASVIFSLGQ
ncbi:DDE transposase [Neoroseomonas lacus]|uniref:DDE transposase n=1 Tax=Neoroseomonas lacus TaxID=287609 RepID=A0A917L428_9PROT|nr:DDE transposase [Neoroseomonas lacus]